MRRKSILVVPRLGANNHHPSSSSSLSIVPFSASFPSTSISSAQPSLHSGSQSPLISSSLSYHPVSFSASRRRILTNKQTRSLNFASTAHLLSNGVSSSSFPFHNQLQLQNTTPTPSSSIIQSRRCYVTETSRRLVEREVQLIEDAYLFGADVSEQRMFNLLRNLHQLGDESLLDMCQDLLARTQPLHRELHSALIRAYAQNKLSNKALELFDKMRETRSSALRPDRSTWNAVIEAFVRLGQRGKALSLLDQMQEEGIRPDIETFNSLITAHVRAGAIEDALDTLAFMKRRRIHPDAHTYTTLIDAHLHIGQKEKAMDLLREMEGYRIAPTLATLTAFVHANCRDNNFEVAQKILERIAAEGMKPNVVTYTAIIDGMVRNKMLDRGVAMLESMRQQGVEPNHVAYTSLIVGFSRQFDVAKCIELWNDMKERGIVPDGFACTMMLRALVPYKSKNSDNNNNNNNNRAASAEVPAMIRTLLEEAVPKVAVDEVRRMLAILDPVEHAPLVEHCWDLWKRRSRNGKGHGRYGADIVQPVLDKFAEHFAASKNEKLAAEVASARPIKREPSDKNKNNSKK